MCAIPCVDDRKVISGILHVIRYGLMRPKAPGCNDLHKTRQSRFMRRSEDSVFDRIYEVVAPGSTDAAVVDNAQLKTCRIDASLLKSGFRAALDAPEASQLEIPPCLRRCCPHFRLPASC